MNYHNAKQTKSLRKNTKGSFDIQSMTAMHDSDEWLISFSLSWSNQSILTRMVNLISQLSFFQPLFGKEARFSDSREQQQAILFPRQVNGN